MEVVAHAYFIDTASNGIPSLYRRQVLGGQDSTSASESTEELAQGIENIQLLFGEDTDGDGVANRYVIGSDVSDWSTVASVRVRVLMRSISAVASEETAFRYNGSSYTPEDKFLRREFTSTIGIRN
jgi:type IV pilus assembly protein PilW